MNKKIQKLENSNNLNTESDPASLKEQSTLESQVNKIKRKENIDKHLHIITVFIIYSGAFLCSYVVLAIFVHYCTPQKWFQWFALRDDQICSMKNFLLSGSVTTVYGEIFRWYKKQYK